MTILTRVGFAAAVASCVASGACSNGPAAPSQEPAIAQIGQSILDGKPDSIHTFVVGVMIAAAESMCSGSLIAPNLVLTAQHCVAPCPPGIDCKWAQFGEPYTGASVFVTFASDMYTAPKSSYRKAAEVYVPPDEDRMVCGYDVALIRLVDNVPNYVATPVNPRVDIQVETGEEYMAIGYGNVNTSQSGAGARRYRDGLHVACVGGVTCPWKYADADHEWQGETSICQGDSGGPAMDTMGRVIGVVSRGPSGCRDPTYGSVYAWADWIKQIAAQAAIAGKYKPAPWVTGGSSDPDAGFVPDSGKDKSFEAPCQNAEECTSGVCAVENDLTRYCSESCAVTSDCPQGFFCSAQGACVHTGGFGSACVNNLDCRSSLCIAADAGSYCSQACGGDAGVCPNSAACSPEGKCLPPAAPQPAQVKSESTGGCSTSTSLPRLASAWVIAAGLAALLRRRART